MVDGQSRKPKIPFTSNNNAYKLPTTKMNHGTAKAGKDNGICVYINKHRAHNFSAEFC